MAARDTVRPLGGIDRSRLIADADGCLMRDAENGSAAAFEMLAARYDRAIVGLLLSLTGSEQAALDLSHATLMAAYRHLHGRREPSLYLCFYRLAAYHWLAWSGARRDEHGHGVLTARERLVFTLKHQQRLALATIAQILDLPHETVSRIFTRAVAKLRSPALVTGVTDGCRGQSA